MLKSLLRELKGMKSSKTRQTLSTNKTINDILKQMQDKSG
jgi:hypothetical protein